ncbi:MAG: branched-chain amino acid transferase [Thiotrichales bacterium]|nr:branched-chain amino acid transferase [Thiotrichales bacterium]
MDGDYRPISEAKISMLDFGFTRSDTTYDVVHVWNGSFFRLEDHLDRFSRSLAKAHMSIPHGRDQMREILMQCVRLTGLRDVYVAMLCTRGLPSKKSRDPRLCENRFYAYAVPFIWIANEQQREQGMHMMVASVPRTASVSVDPTIKNYNWRDMARGLMEAFERGGETVIMLDPDGNVNEGPGFNIFAVIDDKVLTPEEGVLEGITRLAVLEICELSSIESGLATISGEQLLEADEIFITSTAGGIMPITRINDRVLCNGVPGPMTQRLTELYWRKHDEGWHATPVDYD